MVERERSFALCVDLICNGNVGRGPMPCSLGYIVLKVHALNEAEVGFLLYSIHIEEKLDQ